MRSQRPEHGGEVGGCLGLAHELQDIPGDHRVKVGAVVIGARAGSPPHARPNGGEPRMGVGGDHFIAAVGEPIGKLAGAAADLEDPCFGLGQQIRPPAKASIGESPTID